MAIDPITGGALISGAASIAGSFIGSSSQSEANDAMLANAAKDRQLQRNFAKKGIRWRVKDAQAAGIHPLYAMGASLPTYSPSGINIGAKRSGGGLASAGQDIGRAIAATQTQPERDLSIARAALENRYLEAQIANLTRDNQIGPPMPSAQAPGGIAGQGNYPTDVHPRRIEASSRDMIGRAAGAIPDIQYSMGGDGKLRILPSASAKEAMEDQLIPEALFAWRNYAKPLVNRQDMRDRAPSTDEFPLPPGWHWQWSTMDQAYVKTHNSHRRPKGYTGRRTRKPSWEDLQPRTMRIPGKSGIHY